jgi:hypothetical protein
VETNKNNKKKIPLWVKVATSVVIFIVVGLCVWIANSPLFWGTHVANGLAAAKATAVVVAIIAIFVAGVTAVIVPRLMYSKPKRAGAISITGVVVAVVSLALLLPVIPGSPARSAYRSGFDALSRFSENIITTNAPRADYETRLNAAMAENILRASLQDTVAWIPNESQPQYSVVDDAPAWCVGLLAQHRVPMAADRVYAKGVMCLVEESMKTVRADWDVRVPTTQGSYSTNLHKYIARLQRGMSVAEADVRFYIQNGKPHMLAPVTKVVSAGIDVRRVTAGFVTIDPKGSLKLHTSAKAGEWPVPVVAYGTAEQIRASLNTRGGYYCAARLKSAGCVAKAQPLEDTSSIQGAGSAGDPNAGNSTEFVLRREDGRLVMVTPLTPYGNSRNVVAYLEVIVDELAGIKTPTAVLYNVAAEASGLSIAQAVTAAYTADIAWTSEVTEPEAQKSASRIFEITPAGAGEVVATIGNATNPEYLLRVKPALKDGSLQFSYCIHAYGTNEELDCRVSTQPAARIGTLRGVASADDGQTSVQTPVTVDGSLNLDEMTDDELRLLGVAILDEMTRRSK